MFNALYSLGGSVIGYMLIGLCVEYALHKAGDNKDAKFIFKWLQIALWVKRLFGR